jgi:hypothetical protein
MHRRIQAACAVSIALLWAPAAAGSLQAPTANQDAGVPADIARALTRAAPFTPTELAALQAGQVITRTEASPESLEAAVVAAVKIGTTKDRTADYFHLLVSYIDGQVTVGRGVFSRPPENADVAKLALDAGDVTDLAACRSDVCDIRVAGATASETAQAVQAQSADTLEHATAWFRQVLVPYVAGYVSRGHLALAVHDDRGVRIDVPVEWQSIFARSPLLSMLAPQVGEYLTGLPGKPPDGAGEEIYWDKQRYTGLKPVIGVTHMVTWQDPADPQRVVIAQKQIYASRYVFGSLAVTLVQQDSSAAKPTTYVVYANRLRGDLLRGTQPTRQAGFLGRVNAVTAGFQRRMGEELVKQSAEQLLTSMKQQLER